MMNWLHYLLEANLYMAVAYGCYWLLFRKQTFYTANRLYLLLSTTICFVIPLVQIGALQAQVTVHAPAQQVIQISSVVVAASDGAAGDVFTAQNKAITSVYLTVVILMLVLFITKLYSLLKLILKNKRIKRDEYTLVCLDEASTPFSFFGYLFAAGNVQVPENILRHEMVHIRQKHSWDIVFTELVKIINWFNPVAYLLQNSLKALHEFEADRQATCTDARPDSYVDVLIAQACQTSGVPFAHHFSNQQLLKSRIMKLYQKRSGTLARLNYLLAVPLCAGMLCVSTLAFSKSYGWIKLPVSSPTKAKAHSLRLNDTTSKKLRLKVTSGGVTGITDKLEINDNQGLKLVYTAQNLTEQDKKRLMKNLHIKVETTYESISTTTVTLPPPPPAPMKLDVKSKLSPLAPIAPPPPPPMAAPKSRKGKTIMFPPPKVVDAATGKVISQLFEPVEVKFISAKEAKKSPMLKKLQSAREATDKELGTLSIILSDSVQIKN